VFLGIQTLWSLWSWRVITKKLFDPYILFFIAAILFNAGQVFLEIFHLNESGLMKGIFSIETTLDTVFLVAFGLAMFHLGALISTLYNTSNSIAVRQNQVKIQAEDIRTIGWILLAVSVFPALFEFYNALTIVMSVGYFGLFQRDFETSFDAAPQILAAFLVPSSLFIIAGSEKKRVYVFLPLVIIVGYTLTQLFLGSRAKAILPLIAYAWLWHRCIRPISTALLISIGLALLGIIFPLIAAVRNINGGDRNSLNFLVDAFFSIDNPTIAVLSEMGGSMTTVAYTLDLVPHLRYFDMGAGYLYALLTVVPNLFWDIHPTVAHGLAADWLIWTVNPYEARLGGGLGFSFIAEAYLNFGWFGAPVALGVIGLLYARLVLWADRLSDPAKMAMIACFISFFLFYVRQEIASQVRNLVWYSILPYLGAYVIHRLRSRSYLKRRTSQKNVEQIQTVLNTSSRSAPRRSS